MAIRMLLFVIGLLTAASAPAATFVVTSRADTAGATCASVCTLRQAITAANATATADTINFAIQVPIRGEILIQPATNLPPIVQPLTINGYSQSGTRANTSETASNALLRIRLDGALPSTTANHGLAICASGTVIRGLSVTRFSQTGLIVGDTPCAGGVSNVQLHGNFIGVTSTGSNAAGNGNIGVRVLNSGVRIGQTLADRNIISAHGVFGIDLRGGSVSKVVQGNLFGTDRSGSQDFGNATGIRTSDNATTSLILQNLIRFNGTGIDIDSGTDHRILQNVISDNDGLGIDLGSTGVTPNDPDDIDVGANLQQNFPAITFGSRSEGELVIGGFVDIGHSNQIDYQIDVFASDSCDPSGFGEGERLIGTRIAPVSSTSQGIGGRIETDDPLPPGTFITATATPANGVGTSEFSACFPLDPLPLLVNSSDDIDDGVCDTNHCSLREAMNAANAQPGDISGLLFINFAIPPLTGTSEILIAPTTPLPQITRRYLIDGYSQPSSQVNTDTAISNAIPRIRLHGSGAVPIGFDVCIPAVTIRGLAMTGFDQAMLLGQPACVNSASVDVLGNFFGLATDGITAIPNQQAIVGLGHTSNFQIGGVAPEDRNVFAGGESAIEIDTFPGNPGREILGNLFGTDRTATLDRGIDRAIVLRNETGDIEVGAADAPNLFAFNGVAIEFSDDVTKIDFAENRFASQTGLAVDLGADGVTANDVGDVDTGPNALQNFPVLTLAERNVDGIRIIGNVDVPGTPAAGSLTVTFYASANCDPSGHGEGEHILTRVQTGESFDLIVATDVDLSLNPFITATATHTTGTSELSACLVASDAPIGIAVDVATDTLTLDGGCDIVADANTCTLREAITLANAQPGDNRIRFQIAGPDLPRVIEPVALLPVITGGLAIDGYTQAGASPNAATEGFDAVLRIELRPVALGNGLRICATETVEIRGIAFVTGTEPMIAAQANDAGNCAAVGNLRLLGNQFGMRANGDTSAVFTAVSANNSILVAGGPLPANRNIFTNATTTAVRIVGTAASGSVVQNNIFGRDAEGLSHPNDRDIEIQSASNVVVGGEGALANYFFDSNIAVLVGGNNADGNTLYGNRFSGHAAATAIDLSDSGNPDGIASNDANDADSGANQGQNSPQLSGGAPTSGGVNVEGTLDLPLGIPSPVLYRLAFYHSATCSDAPGIGREGQTFLRAVLQPSTSTTETFSVALDLEAQEGFITATATAPDGSTSEFSNCLVRPRTPDIFGDGFE